MNIRAWFCLTLLAVITLGCAPAERKPLIFPVGDKVYVQNLTYSISDTQILPNLGEPPNQRLPQNRFYIVGIEVHNSGNSPAIIPGMTLIDDAGQTYGELSDGSGVGPKWFGVIRKVEPNQTERKSVVFDAPARHYKLKLTDDTDPEDIAIDLPLSFAHEQIQNETGTTSRPLVPEQPAKKSPDKQ